MIINDFSFKIGVDEFDVECDIYFLTHCHQDHMKGFPKQWNSEKPLILSKISRDILISRKYTLNQNIITVLPGDELLLENAGIKVTTLDANHCIGSLIFVLESEDKKVIYTGDFKYCPTNHKEIEKFKKVHKLYIDTTYNHPDYIFPQQETAINEIIRIIRKNNNKQIYIGVYEIGKEKILLKIYELFGKPFYVPLKKYRLYNDIGLGKIVTRNKESTKFCAYSRIYLEGKYFKPVNNSVVIIPTGWSIDNANKNNYYYVPYSEHCDFIELNSFIELINPKEIVSICDYF